MSARIVGIWLTGLLASATLAGGILFAIDHDAVGAGVFGGALAFACLRLWIGERRPMDLPIRRFGGEQ